MEVGLPIGDAAQVAERLTSVRVGDRRRRVRGVLQPADVPGDPILDRVVAAEPEQRLGRHRAVVGQAAAVLRPRDRESVVGAVEDAAAILTIQRQDRRKRTRSLS